ncbi:MAG TPA: VanZ family protein [Thiobacillaceae bacterium]|nr:VanZ family protein [Thiobacillaceae bacterium]HNU63118.1 VanZ family protein [Thiobacillaceae bacterium]
MGLRPCWLALGWLLVAAVCWLSLTTQPPDLGEQDGDKLGHLLAYFSLMAWWGQLDVRRNLLLGLFLLLGLMLEGLQGLIPMRQPSGLDMLANATGAGLGWLITRAWPDWLPRLERRWRACCVRGRSRARP